MAEPRTDTMIQLLFRSMKHESELPLVGTDGFTLGARPKIDVSYSKDGLVKPSKNGMSTFDNPGNIPHHLRPEYLGNGATGSAELAIFQINRSQLNCNELEVTPSFNERGHYQVCPSRLMSLDEYQSKLADTRSKWGKI